MKKNNVAVVIGKYWLLFFTIVIFVVFSILRPNFARTSNIINIVASTCITAIAGMGLTSIMAAGEIDFSAGTQVSFSTVIMGLILSSRNFNSFFAAAVITILIMLCVGGVNAIIHVKLKVPAFIATMGVSYLITGIAKRATDGGSTIYRNVNWPANYTLLGQGRIGGVLPYSIIVLVIVSVIMYIFMERTKWGKSLYAVGSNPRACDLLGISGAKQKTIGFLLCSLWSALAGIVLTSQLNMAGITVGSTMLQSMTVLMLGSTFIKQGVYNIPGTLIASFLLQSIFYAMKMMGAGAWMEDLVQGVILVLSVAVVCIIRRKGT